MPDLYELGRPLGRRGLFQLVSDEAFCDGVLEPFENDILGALARFLKIDPQLARSIARMSREKYKAGAFTEKRRLDPERLFCEVLRFAYADHEPGPKELAMLAGMQKLLKLADADRARLEARVRGEAGGALPAAPMVEPARLVDVAAEGARLARGGQWRETEAAWRDLLASGSLAEEAAAPLARAFEELVDLRVADGPVELVPGVVTMAERLARAEPPDPLRWIAVGAAGHRAIRALASAGRFALVQKVVRAMEPMPPDADEAQAHHAEALASWGILAMKAGQGDEVQRAGAALAALSARAKVPEVERARATSLSCALEWWVTFAKDPGPAGAALEALHALVEEHGDDRSVAHSFALASQFALMMLLILRDFAGVSAHLAKVRMASGAHVGDEEVQFAFARGLVNAAIQVNGMDGDAASKASALSALETTLNAVASACPWSADLTDAKERFGRIKADAPVAAARAAAAPPRASAPIRAPGPPPEDVRTMRAVFDAMQAGRTPPAPAFAILEIVGTGGYPRRVKEQGERIYAADEPYFLHLLAELERELTGDRIGFWSMQRHVIELATRYMIEDATPAIADAARRVRHVAGFDEP